MRFFNTGFIKIYLSRSYVKILRFIGKYVRAQYTSPNNIA
nr:MAG TPA: hypothetical protein [Caudoviricetes sp.]DAO40830.1 MAG TPA: hypothetical protein [Bacteriophage sp.]DAM68657.1 MAG TPA: hypothetical protein [Caudoviricetes sp.]DAQ08192.1 MAG TPA: hypothetical protein [Caudoviricetes sp.]DAQ55829.1 MAG TPA: hypothetical protein [Caudoviricetes sp.]